MMKQSAEKTTSKNAVKTVISSIWRTAGGKYSLIMLAIWLVVSAISLVWTPYSLLDTDGFNTWASPSGAHMLGTDGVGADVLSWLDGRFPYESCDRAAYRGGCRGHRPAVGGGHGVSP